MRKYLLSMPAIIAAALVISQPVAAQDKDKDKEKPKVNTNEEIVIKRKTDKDEKITIEIKGDDITVNGKPLEDFDDEDIVVRKRKSQGTTIYSPFRGQSGVMNFNSDDHFWNGSNTAFLGVITKKDDRGAKIEKVTEGSAADKAGLKSGDVISRVDDDQIEDADDLTKAIRKHKPEDKVTISYYRDGKQEKTTATLGKGSSFTFSSPRVDIPEFKFEMPDNYFHDRTWTIPSKGRLGIKAQDTEDGKGVKVLDVEDESAAEKAGIREDDIITEFDGKKVNSTEELANFAREAREKAAVKISFNRNGKSQTVEVKTPRKLKTANL